jgi:uncharacterized protein YndB with AHSA1/START domain
MSATTALPPLVKSVTVAAPLERAFDLFTTGLDQWWPLASHSVGEESATSVAMACRVGGRIVETVEDGTTHVWGKLTEWSPSTRLAFTWHPGQPEAEATLVTVTFRADGEQTEVQLVHTGWDSRPDGARARTGYNTGWDVVLGHLTALAAPGRS